MPILVDAAPSLDPQAPLAALHAAAAMSLRRELELILVGDEAWITTELSRLAHDPTHLMVRHADPEPPGASLHRAAELMARGQGGALVTAGDPALLVQAAQEHLELLPGAPQPALCAVYPTARRRGSAHDPYVLILDVGAAPQADAQALVGFARMGSAYASRISRNHKPRVALLAGEFNQQIYPPAAQEAVEVLRQDPQLHWLGTLDAVDIAQGAADVIVCEGYTGRTVIRLLEGVGDIAEQLARSASKQNMKWRLAMQMISDGMGRMQSIADWKNYGGAPLLGYPNPIICASPHSDAEAMGRAIRLAAKAIRKDIPEALRQGLRPPQGT